MSAEVLLRGKRVGTVSDIFFDARAENIMIELTVDRAVSIPRNAEVHIISTGIAGQKAVEIVFDQGCTGDDCARSGDYLIGVRKGLIESIVSKDELNVYLAILRDGLGDIIDTLGIRFSEQEEANEFLENFKRIGNTIKNLESITTNVDGILKQSNRDITGIASNVHSATALLDERIEQIGATLDNLENLTNSLVEENLAARIGGTFDRADEGLEGLTASLSSFNQTLQLLNDGDGTLARLLNDPEIAENLGSSLQNLNFLLQDIRLNPHRYTHVKVTLFGRGKRDNYELPEDDPAFN